MPALHLTGPVQRFDGPGGWHHVRLNEAQSAEYGPLVRSVWPALHPVEVRWGEVTWRGALMPIKDGPLFVVVPAKVRRKHHIEEGDEVQLEVELLSPDG